MGISHTMGVTRVPSDLFHRGPQKLLLRKILMVSTTTIDPYRADNSFCPTDTVCRCYLPESFPALSPSYPARTRICTRLQSVPLCLHECKTVASIWVTDPYGCVSLGSWPCVHAHCSSDACDWVPMWMPLVSYSEYEMYTQIRPHFLSLACTISLTYRYVHQLCTYTLLV